MKEKRVEAGKDNCTSNHSNTGSEYPVMWKGYFTFVLHTHMPYVRKNGIWPVGEDWLYQVISDTYIPLLGALAQLEHEGVDSCLALTLTPVLCEQLRDRYIQERIIAYFNNMIEHIREDINDFKGRQDHGRLKLADSYLEDYRRRLKAYEAIDGDIVGALKYFEDIGMIEIIGSCATHAFLPAQTHWKTIKTQVSIGIESHRTNIGKDPKGFWLPECAYREGVEELLESEGIKYLIVDSTALPDLPDNRPTYIEGSNVTALQRSSRAHANIWCPVSGYPTGSSYLDSTKRHHNSGLYYWSVTGMDVPIEDKKLYEPKQAMETALYNCEHFMKSIKEEIDEEPDSGKQVIGDNPPLVLAGFDTELFGNAWREGIYWMELTLRSLAGSDSVGMTLPHKYLEENPPSISSRVGLTSWGDNNDHSTWVNPETEWIWSRLEAAQQQFFEIQLEYMDTGDVNIRRAVDQAAREILLLESSDWPFMVAKDRARKYATERFNKHLERFEIIFNALQTGIVEDLLAQLGEIEEMDNIFHGAGWNISSHFIQQSD